MIMSVPLVTLCIGLSLLGGNPFYNRIAPLGAQKATSWILIKGLQKGQAQEVI
jgi:hypothetical protein